MLIRRNYLKVLDIKLTTIMLKLDSNNYKRSTYSQVSVYDLATPLFSR